MDVEQYREAADRNQNREYREEEAMAHFIRQSSDTHAEGKRHSPWRYRVQLCLDRCVTIATDDGGREVSIPVGWYDLNEDESAMSSVYPHRTLRGLRNIPSQNT
jgi:hypothetical protein